MLLSGLPVALSQDNSCMLAQTSIRNAENKNFQTAFITLYQNLPMNLCAILQTFQFNMHFPKISDAVTRILCACLFLTSFFLFSNGRNTL